ncbi:uncharacterized protein [Clytia hemisphaerica]|uniref:uncharacterized protein n=1 Tax=Clytia hemisphaerica TaxID=252671 RepID=UPI0034D6E06B
MFKTYSVCSHSLLSARDNKCLQQFIKLSLKKPTKLTPAATFGANKNAGKKPNQSVRSRKRKSTTAETVPQKRMTLDEVLKDTEADEEIACGNYSVIESTPGSLKMKMGRGSVNSKPKYVPTTSTPFQLLDIQGNIRVCAGCKGDLVDGPSPAVPNGFDYAICIRHEEHDHFYHKQRQQWIKKFEKKHYHISLNCLRLRNPHFNHGNLEICLKKQNLNHTMKNFLIERLS